MLYTPTLFAFQRRLLARFVCTVIGIAAFGSPVLHAERLPFRIYNASHGLAHDRIRCVLADSRGFLWFCTADGLSRFDGTRFVNYGVEHGLPHPEVNAIVEAGPGVYWVATELGLARLRANTDSSSTVKSALPLTVYSPGTDAAAKHVFRLKVDRAGRMWIGTAAGLFLLESPAGEPRFRRVDPEPPLAPFGPVEALAEGPDGTLWIGSSSGLFRRLPNDRIVRDHIIPGTEEIGRLLADRSGRVWTSSGQGLSVAGPTPTSASSGASPGPRELRVCAGSSSDAGVPATPGDACRFETIAGLPAVVRTLWEGSDGHVWIGTSGGLIEFDGDRFRVYAERHGLSNEAVNAVAEDHAGDLWVGTDAGGVARLTRQGLVSFKEADGLRHDYVTWIFQSRSGRVRAGGGWPVVNEFDGERFTSSWFPIPRQMEWARLYDVFEDHTGDLWVGVPGGLLRFPEVPRAVQLARARLEAGYSVADGLPSGRIAPSFEDSRGDVWMTAYDGYHYRVVRWQRTTGRFHQHPETDSPLVSLRGPAFAEDSAGTVWLGSSRGLARHRDTRFATVRIGDATRVVPVTSVHVDLRGRLWVGTRGAGLFRSDDPAAERPRFTTYAAADGLSSDTVWCLTSDRAGNVYAGTTRGVDQLQPKTGRLTRFSVADGLAGSEVITAFRDRDGALWFGTLTGISRLVPRADVERAPPTAWIGGLRIRGVEQPLGVLGQLHVSIGTLAPEQNQVQIDYFGLSPAPAEFLTYQHQLEAADSTWSAPTTERTVNYAELAPGSYRFLVRAVSANGRASRSPASVSFTILPPVWKRGWFIGSLVLLTAATGYSVHRYRVKRLFEMERLRTRIASDLHDDVGSSLTQISMLSEIVRTRLASGGAAIDDPLSRIGTLSRESVDSMSDIVWAIDPRRDTPVHLLQRMRRLAYELLGSAGIQLRFESSGDARPRLTTDVRHHVFLMFKEVLNNVVRHAAATLVCIEVTVAARQLHVVISDDGRGFDTATPTEGQGLRSLERRAASLGGSLQVASSPGHGTRVAFRVPAQ